MVQTFNELLLAAGIDPGDVAILHHHTPKLGAKHPTIAALREHDPVGFKLYQETQKPRRPLFRNSPIWATFVQPSKGDIVFAGLFDAELSDTRIADWLCPYRGDKPGKGGEVDLFVTSLRSELSNQIDQLRVVWPRKNVRTWERYSRDLYLPVVERTVTGETAKLLDGKQSLASLTKLGFALTRETKKIFELRRFDQIVYVKRETLRQPLVLHPRFRDFAEDFASIPGVDVTLPSRSYINSNLREFPSYITPHRDTVGRHGFALGAVSQALPAVFELFDRLSQIVTDSGPVRAIAPNDNPLTTRERLAAARIGQGDFRDALIAFWSGSCPLSGLDHLQVLRASHIKPWSKSNDRERLDPYNGLLLGAHIDAVFDCGLISFENDGLLLISSKLSTDNCTRLGIRIGGRIAGLGSEHAPYLAYHRGHVFRT